jgi:ribosomal protein S18 acetylase RimI-like enzyme
MEIVNIHSENKDLLLKFLTNKIPSTFRYFLTRNVDCIHNHELTVIATLQSIPVGYGHIDKDENNTYWLGVCVLDGYQNNGYGQSIIRYLLKHSHSKSICLTVDKDNLKAVSLYQRFGFKTNHVYNTYYKMCLDR